MNSVSFSDQELRLFAMGGSFLAVNMHAVNLDDLCSARPGGIVRVKGDPAKNIKWYSSDDSPVGCVAGWMSEEE